MVSEPTLRSGIIPEVIVSKTETPTIMTERVAALDWRGIAAALDAHGCAVVTALVAPEACQALAAGYEAADAFRSRVVMARHGFGSGEYKYFAYPLPPVVQALRVALYPPLAAIANRLNEAMGIDVRYPTSLDDYLERCHRAGQTKPTPLVLRYAEGDYNCLHQDVYGEHLFPLQATVLLSAPVPVTRVSLNRSPLGASRFRFVARRGSVIARRGR